MSKQGKVKILNFRPVNDGDKKGDSDSHEILRMIEALIFASREPVSEKDLMDCLPQDVDLKPLMVQLRRVYAGRGINLIRSGDSWAFRTADDLSFLLQKETVENKKLSRAALETLAIIAYHQPVTRAEIEEVRGVVVSRGTLDMLLQTGWVKMRGRRRTAGRPVTYGVSDNFLSYFGLETLSDLPGHEELRGAGLLQSQLPANFLMPLPGDDPEFEEDEDPITAEDIEDLALLPPSSD